MTLPRISLLLAFVGAALVLAGVLVGPAALGFEGAFFTRAVGAPTFSSVGTEWGSGDALLSPYDGNLWLGAGLACLLGALGGLLAHATGLQLVRAPATDDAQD